MCCTSTLIHGCVMATTETAPLAKVFSTRPAQRGPLRNITPASRFYWVRVLLANPMVVASGLTLVFIIGVAAAAPLLTSYNPTFLDPGIRLQGLSGEHWFGT